jgi:transportin-3
VQDEQRPAFRDSLLAHLGASLSGPKLVLDRLGLCVASLVLHMGCIGGQGDPRFWEDPLHHLCHLLGSERGAAVSLINIMTCVPDEFNNRSLFLDTTQRRRAMHVIAEFSETLLRMLTSYLQSAGSDTTLQVAVFKCFLSWIKSADLPLDTFADLPLFNSVFEAIKVPMLFEVCCDVIIETLRQTEDMRRYPTLTKVL